MTKAQIAQIIISNGMSCGPVHKFIKCPSECPYYDHVRGGCTTVLSNEPEKINSLNRIILREYLELIDD